MNDHDQLNFPPCDPPCDPLNCLVPQIDFPDDKCVITRCQAPKIASRIQFQLFTLLPSTKWGHSSRKDLFDEVILKVRENQDQYNGDGFHRWISQIALNHIRDFFRDLNRKKEGLSRLQNHFRHENSLTEDFIPEKELIPYLGKLTEKQQIVFKLYYFPDENSEEICLPETENIKKERQEKIARCLGCSQENVSQTLKRARERLKNLIKDDEYPEI